MNLLQQH